MQQQAEVREAVLAHVTWWAVEESTLWRLVAHAERGQDIGLRGDVERERARPSIECKNILYAQRRKSGSSECC